MAQTTVGTPRRIQYIPHPRDMVQIHGGTPYIVPAGKLFTLTGLGDSMLGAGIITLLVKGSAEVAVSISGPSAPSVIAVPPGFTAPAGSTIDLSGSGSGVTARARGYLVNQ